MTRRCKKPKLKTAAGDSTPHQIARIGNREGEPPSVYLVVGHEVTRPSYSVFEVNPFPDGGDDDDDPVPFPLPLVRLDAKQCMSFVPVRSRLGRWIVGVGGNTVRDYAPETIVYDTKTRDVIPGPKLLSTKFHPIVLPIGDRIYALARNPSVKGEVNFVPWFEVLDLSQAQVVDGHLVSCEWKALPRPPCFPWELTPRQYIFPPEVTVKAFVVVGHRILLSITGQMGTHMFDTETEQWAKLDNKDLPFLGGAIPHGPLFLGYSGTSKENTLYKITICKAATSSSPSMKEECASLSIVEFPVVSGMEAEDQIVSSCRFVSLGNHDNPGFCTFRCCSDDPLPAMDLRHTRELVTMRTYTSESQDHVESTEALLISKQWKQVYSICDTTRRLAWPCLEDIVQFDDGAYIEPKSMRPQEMLCYRLN